MRGRHIIEIDIKWWNSTKVANDFKQLIQLLIINKLTIKN